MNGEVNGEEATAWAGGGTEVASYLEQELFDKILADPNFRDDPKKTIKETYFSMDKRILGKAENEKDFRAGSTATTAFLLDGGSRLVVANVGDSRAILARNRKAVEVSVDHEPQKPEEREMVESKGGEVAVSPIGGVYRVDKRLNMTRAFGDYSIKEHLSVEPDIWDNILTDDDDFFVVASDGLWNVMSNDEAVEHVLAQTTAEGAAKVLAAAALRRGSRDDISVLVVCLKDLSSLS
uniref:PPM-type phosphatase domain-containing protein n=1 Tax=Physcomitrium patens TaxID=3218 RepID=A0A7I4B5P4_PHYPA